MKTNIIINRLKDLRDKGECVSETMVLEQAIKCIEALNKIRAELHETAEMHEDGNYYLREEWIDEIIDKYREVSE